MQVRGMPDMLKIFKIITILFDQNIKRFEIEGKYGFV